jgi:hypothetical protein
MIPGTKQIGLQITINTFYDASLQCHFTAFKRNPYTVTEKDIISGFSKLDKIIESPEGIDCFKGEYWELIKEDLKECIEKYNS